MKTKLFVRNLLKSLTNFTQKIDTQCFSSIRIRFVFILGGFFFFVADFTIESSGDSVAGKCRKYVAL